METTTATATTSDNPLNEFKIIITFIEEAVSQYLRSERNQRHQ